MIGSAGKRVTALLISLVVIINIAFAQEDEKPLDPVWVANDVKSVRFVIGLLPLLGLAIPVFSETVPLPRWSHWEHPAYWPGLAHVANPGAVAVAAFGVTTWFLLLLAALRIPTMWFLFVIQTLALLAAPVGMLDY